MSKYELELNDDQAESLIKVLEYAATPGDLSGFSSDLALSAAADLKAQIPIPVPVKVGAVVLTEGDLNGGIYIRWIPGDMSVSPWILARDHEQPYRTDEIGRITAVLSPGVDL